MHPSARLIVRPSLPALIAMVALSLAPNALADALPGPHPSQAPPSNERDSHRSDDRGATRAKTSGALLEAVTAMGGVAGTVVKDAAPMSRAASPLITAGLTVGYRWDHFLLGATTLAGTGAPTPEGDFEACSDETVKCSTALLRYGLQARFYALPGSPIEPWLGVGVGREHFTVSVAGTEEPMAIVASGNNLLNLRLGTDFRLRSPTIVTAFVDYSLGEFNELKTGLEGDGAVAPNQRSFHHWILVGAGFAWLK